MRGRTGAIRQQALKKADFNAAERHGKRLDVMGPARRVRDDPPLVYGSLDLADALEKHMAGVQQQGETEAIHMLVQYPTDLKFGVDPDKTKRAMLNHAVKFANKYHGGDAVFAARYDRDEEGQHTVDVFLMPRYDFTYKDGRTAKRAAVSKFSKQQARARSADLIEPGEKLHPESPIMQGRALQAAWHEYLRDDCRLGDFVQAPDRKKIRTKDRLEPEELALQRKKTEVEADALMMRAKAREEARTEADSIIAKAKRQVVEALEAIDARKAAVEAREQAVARDAAILAAARRIEGRPDPQIESIVDRARSRRRPVQDQH